MLERRNLVAKCWLARVGSHLHQDDVDRHAPTPEQRGCLRSAGTPRHCSKVVRSFRQSVNSHCTSHLSPLCTLRTMSTATEACESNWRPRQGSSSAQSAHGGPVRGRFTGCSPMQSPCQSNRETRRGRTFIRKLLQFLLQTAAALLVPIHNQHLQRFKGANVDVLPGQMRANCGAQLHGCTQDNTCRPLGNPGRPEKLGTRLKPADMRPSSLPPLQPCKT